MSLEALQALEDKLLDLANDMPEIVAKVADKFKDEMAELNRDQLMSGIRPDGSAIKPDYSPYTVARKKAEGRPANKVTLFDEGNYQGKIKFKRFSEGYEGDSEDPKAEALRSKYGDVLGLTETNLEKLGQKMLPDLIEETRRRIL